MIDMGLGSRAGVRKVQDPNDGSMSQCVCFTVAWAECCVGAAKLRPLKTALAGTGCDLCAHARGRGAPTEIERPGRVAELSTGITVGADAGDCDTRRAPLGWRARAGAERTGHPARLCPCVPVLAGAGDLLALATLRDLCNLATTAESEQPADDQAEH